MRYLISTIFIMLGWCLVHTAPEPPMPNAENTFWGLDTTKNSLPHEPWCEYFVRGVTINESGSIYLPDSEVRIFLTGSKIYKIDQFTCSFLDSVYFHDGSIANANQYQPSNSMNKVIMIPTSDRERFLIITPSNVWIYSTEDLSVIDKFTHHFNGEKDFEHDLNKTYILRDVVISNDDKRLLIHKYKQEVWDDYWYASVFDLEGNMLHSEVPRPIIDKQNGVAIRYNNYLTGYIRIVDYATNTRLQSILFDGTEIKDELVISKDADTTFFSTNIRENYTPGLQYLLSAHDRNGEPFGETKLLSYNVDPNGNFIDETIIEHDIDLEKYVINNVDRTSIGFHENITLFTHGYTYSRLTGRIVSHKKSESPYSYVNKVQTREPSYSTIMGFQENVSSGGKIENKRYEIYKKEPGRYVQDWMDEHYSHVFDSISKLKMGVARFRVLWMEEEASSGYSILYIKFFNGFFPDLAKYTTTGEYFSNLSFSYVDNYIYKAYAAVYNHLLENDITIYVFRENPNSLWVDYWGRFRNFTLTSVEETADPEPLVFPNPLKAGETINLSRLIESGLLIDRAEVYDGAGRLVPSELKGDQINIRENAIGTYQLILFKDNENVFSQQFIVGG